MFQQDGQKVGAQINIGGNQYNAGGDVHIVKDGDNLTWSPEDMEILVDADYNFKKAKLALESSEVENARLKIKEGLELLRSLISSATAVAKPLSPFNQEGQIVGVQIQVNVAGRVFSRDDKIQEAVAQVEFVQHLIDEDVDQAQEYLQKAIDIISC